MKTRCFVVTDWNMNSAEQYQALVDEGQIRYIAWSAEVAPSTGRLHNQMWCYFHNPKSTSKRSLCKIADMFGNIHCEVQPMRGSLVQNDAYCSKEATLQEVGKRPSQGERGDIKERVAAIMSGETTADEICVENPEFFHQYGRTLDRAETIALRRRWRTWMTEGIWYTGGTGSGKSHAAFAGEFPYDPETTYIKNLSEDFWDGYKGQETVIFNEFRGQISLSELFDLVDKWPKNVKIKGKESVPFLAKRVIVTSIKSPRQCYSEALLQDEPWGQFERRFKTIRLLSRTTP